MGKTKCCNCNKEIGMASFKFSNTELWDISSHPKVTTMSSDDRLCSVCKKLFEEELNPEKHEDVQTNRENKTTESAKFCPKCGTTAYSNIETPPTYSTSSKSSIGMSLVFIEKI